MKILIINILLILSLAQNAWGQATAATGAAGTAAETGAMSSLKKYFDSSAGVLTVSGIATVYSTILYKAAAKQEEESKENIKKLDKIIASFKDSYANMCPNGRENLKEPNCYCYLANGQKNSNRSNSKVCTDLWAKNSYKLTGDAANYNSGTYTADVAGCINVNGSFDQNCQCRKLIDAKGNNACKKTATISIPSDSTSLGIASGSGLNNLLKYAANASNGNPRFDLVNTPALNTNAVRTSQIAEQLTSKLPAGVKVPKIDEANVHKHAAAVLGKNNMDGLLASAGGKASAMNVGEARSNNPGVENLLKQAQVKAGLDLSSGKGLDGGSSDSKKPGLNFNFADGGSSGNGQVIQDFPEEEKTYKYKNSDIVTDNSTSIFDIISNRYIQSGLKRLFEEPTNN